MPTMSLPPKSTPRMIWYRPFLAEVYLARLLAFPSQLSDALVEGVAMDGVVVEGVMAAVVVESAGLRTAPQTASLWTAGIWSFLRQQAP